MDLQDITQEFILDCVWIALGLGIATTGSRQQLHALDCRLHRALC
jgi:hypothetical protein